MLAKMYYFGEKQSSMSDGDLSSDILANELLLYFWILKPVQMTVYNYG